MGARKKALRSSRSTGEAMRGGREGKRCWKLDSFQIRDNLAGRSGLKDEMEDEERDGDQDTSC